MIRVTFYLLLCIHIGSKLLASQVCQKLESYGPDSRLVGYADTLFTKVCPTNFDPVPFTYSERHGDVMRIKDWSDRLIWATMVVGIVRYAAAFAASDVGQITGLASDILTVALSLTGIGMGILDTVGGGLLFNGWSRVFPKNGQAWSMRFKVLTFCVFGLLISGLFILVPFTMSRISQESVLSALGGRNSIWAWVWSTMVNLIPYILIAGVFTGNKMVSSLDEESNQKPTRNLPESSESNEKVTSNLPTNWKVVGKLLSKQQKEFLANHDPKDIVAELSKSNINISPRTASNWRVYAAEELGITLKEN